MVQITLVEGAAEMHRRALLSVFEAQQMLLSPDVDANAARYLLERALRDEEKARALWLARAR